MIRKAMLFGVLILIALFLILEFYMRIFGHYCEPYFDKQSKIVKRRKNTEGIYKTDFTNSGYFRINNEGWNSHRDYYRRVPHVPSMEKKDMAKDTSSKIRFAIIGHSNIEGLRVPVDKTLSKIFEDGLNKNGIPAEVYTFGYGGMHLAQALHVSRYVAKTFQPDIIIIGTFLDNFQVGATNKKNFLNLNINDGMDIIEVIPQKFVHNENSPLSFFYFSKLVKYADKKTGIGKKFYYLLNRTPKISSETKEKPTVYPNQKKIIGIEYILHGFEEISTMEPDCKIPIFFINFPLTVPSYNYDFRKIRPLVSRKIVETVQNHNFQVIDLEKTFIEDYYIDSVKFDFNNDYHYNEHAHKVIGMKLSDFFRLYLKQNPIFVSSLSLQ